MKDKLFKHAKKILPFIGLILLIFYIIFNLNFEDVQAAFFKVSPIFIIIALALSIPRLIIRNYAWQIILKEQLKLSLLKLLKSFCELKPQNCKV